MKCRCIVASLALACLVVSPGWAQSRSDEVKRLHDEIQYLQKRLQSLESEEQSSISRERSSQLGSSRIRKEIEEDKEDVLIVRIYDLSDLLAPVNSYPAMVFSDLGSSNVPIFPDALLSELSGISGMGGMGGMMSAPSSPPAKPSGPASSNALFQAGMTNYAVRPGRPSAANDARTDLDGLVDAITSAINPTSWDEVGGPGTIAPLGNALIVSNTQNVHEQITALLDVFRKRWGSLRTVSVRADWLWLTDAQLNALLIKDAKSFAGESRAFCMVDENAWSARAEELQRVEKDSPAGYRAVLTCYNGQTVHAVSGEQRQFIVSMIPVVGGAEGADSGVGYQPVVATLQEGAVLQVTPMITTAGKYVVLDVHSRVVLLDEPEKPKDGEYHYIQPIVHSTQAVTSSIDRPKVSNSHLETTLRVPVDRRVLVGGMTFQARPKKGEPGLYLFVKLGVQELRDDPTEPKAVAKPAAAAGNAPPLKSAGK